MKWTMMCGICTWETSPHSTYENAHGELWSHYNAIHPYQRDSNGNRRRKP